jgi:hypothetical protein
MFLLWSDDRTCDHYGTTCCNGVLTHQRAPDEGEYRLCKNTGCCHLVARVLGDGNRIDFLRNHRKRSGEGVRTPSEACYPYLKAGVFVPLQSPFTLDPGVMGYMPLDGSYFFENENPRARKLVWLSQFRTPHGRRPTLYVHHPAVPGKRRQHQPRHLGRVVFGVQPAFRRTRTPRRVLE